jgi:hypothetical protein
LQRTNLQTRERRKKERTNEEIHMMAILLFQKLKSDKENNITISLIKYIMISMYKKHLA